MTMRESILKYIDALCGAASRAGGLRLAAMGGAAGLALGLALSAGAAPSLFTPVSEVLGLGGEHGAAVSQAVHDARAAATEDGGEDEAEGEGGEEGEDSAGVGAAVSQAACEAAHDRGTLPPGAQNAPGQQDREPKDCTSEEGDAEEEAAEEVEEALADEAEEGEFANHGAAVSQAVHDAKADLEDGEKLGPAVSKAACEAAHDRSTLPEGAQNAPGQAGREPKDCTHPSNSGDGEESEEEVEESAESSGANGGNGRGRDSAPGQQKKQQ